jgi:hypothetical protein
LLDNFATGLTDLGFLHFKPQVGSFTSSLTHAGEYGVTTVGASHPSDQLLKNNRLAQPSTAEQTSFATPNERSQQIDNLDTGLEDFCVGGQFRNGWSSSVNGPVFVSGDGTTLIDRITQNIEYATERSAAYRNRNWPSQVDAILTAHQSVRATESNTTNLATTEVLLHFACEVDPNPLFISRNLYSVINRREFVLWKLCVKGRAYNLANSTHVLFSCNTH